MNSGEIQSKYPLSQLVDCSSLRVVVSLVQ
jgi:hypothetical protein